MSNIEYLAAGNHTTSREDLALLALSKEAKIRGRVAENPSCPTIALRALVQDEHPEVRSNVAANPKATFQMMRQLAKDFSLNVRYTLAEDHNLPRPLLKMLWLKLGMLAALPACLPWRMIQGFVSMH